MSPVCVSVPLLPAAAMQQRPDRSPEMDDQVRDREAESC